MSESFQSFRTARRGLAAFLLFITLTLIVSCTAAIDQPEFQAAQSAKLASEMDAASQETAQRKRLFYIGLALFREKWSENDVVNLGTRLRQVANYEVVPLIASNAITSLPETYPVADEAAVAALVDGVARWAKSDDVVFIYITHTATEVRSNERSEIFLFKQFPLVN
jgi:hypothetical protein